MKINKKRIIKISIIPLWLTLFIICFINMKNNDNNNNINVTSVALVEDTIPSESMVVEEEEPVVIETETYTKMYSSVILNIRQEPNINSQIIDTVKINTELQIVDNSESNGWVKVKIDDEYYYVANKYLSNEKVKINTTKSNSNTTKTYNSQNNTGVLTKSKGVNYFNGHKETWYSQRVLPGGGLKIPGRHVNAQGLVCDGDGYICVASSDYPKGTIVETSLGTGKVYDCGCASGIIDIYTDW